MRVNGAVGPVGATGATGAIPTEFDKIQLATASVLGTAGSIEYDGTNVYVNDAVGSMTIRGISTAANTNSISICSDYTSDSSSTSEIVGNPMVVKTSRFDRGAYNPLTYGNSATMSLTGIYFSTNKYSQDRVITGTNNTSNDSITTDPGEYYRLLVVNQTPGVLSTTQSGAGFGFQKDIEYRMFSDDGGNLGTYISGFEYSASTGTGIVGTNSDYDIAFSTPAFWFVGKSNFGGTPSNEAYVWLEKVAPTISTVNIDSYIIGGQNNHVSATGSILLNCDGVTASTLGTYIGNPIILKDLPTSYPGVEGQLWNSGGFLMVATASS